jgi:predicted small lipoprotein YifL
MRVACIMLLFALLLQGCGHKGPLVLPQAQPSLQKSAAQQPEAPQPTPNK